MAMTRTLIADRLVLGTAGALALLGSALALWHSPLWLGLTALVGANLIIFATTGFCPMARVLKKLGYGPACCG